MAAVEIVKSLPSCVHTSTVNTSTGGESEKKGPIRSAAAAAAAAADCSFAYDSERLLLLLMAHRHPSPTPPTPLAVPPASAGSLTLSIAPVLVLWLCTTVSAVRCPLSAAGEGWRRV